MAWLYGSNETFTQSTGTGYAFIGAQGGSTSAVLFDYQTAVITAAAALPASIGLLNGVQQQGAIASNKSFAFIDMNNGYTPYTYSYSLNTYTARNGLSGGAVYFYGAANSTNDAGYFALSTGAIVKVNWSNFAISDVANSLFFDGSGGLSTGFRTTSSSVLMGVGNYLAGYFGSQIGTYNYSGSPPYPVTYTLSLQKLTYTTNVLTDDAILAWASYFNQVPYNGSCTGNQSAAFFWTDNWQTLSYVTDTVTTGGALPTTPTGSITSTSNPAEALVSYGGATYTFSFANQAFVATTTLTTDGYAGTSNPGWF